MSQHSLLKKKNKLAKVENLEKDGRLGLFDTKNNSRQIMEEFVKLQLHKFKKCMPHLKKSKSVMQQMSKHKVVFGGSVGVQDANAEGAFGTSHFADPKEKLLEDIRNSLAATLEEGEEVAVKEYDDGGDATSGHSIKSEASEKKREFERIAHKSYMEANRHRLKTNKVFRKNTKLAEKVLNEVDRINREKSKSPEQFDQEKPLEERQSVRNRAKSQATIERIKYKNYKPSAIIQALAPIDHTHGGRDKFIGVKEQWLTEKFQLQRKIEKSNEKHKVIRSILNLS